MIWTMRYPGATPDLLGLVPAFLSEADARPAREQIEDRYGHGGGWLPMRGFRMLADGRLSYPGDPPVVLIAETRLRDEVIRFYDHSWLAVIQPDGSFEVSRVD